MVSIVAFDAYLRAVPEGKRKAIAALRAEWDLQDSMDWVRMTPAERDDYAPSPGGDRPAMATGIGP